MKRGMYLILDAKIIRNLYIMTASCHILDRGSRTGRALKENSASKLKLSAVAAFPTTHEPPNWNPIGYPTRKVTWHRQNHHCLGPLSVHFKSPGATFSFSSDTLLRHKVH